MYSVKSSKGHVERNARFVWVMQVCRFFVKMHFFEAFCRMLRVFFGRWVLKISKFQDLFLPENRALATARLYFAL